MPHVGIHVGTAPLWATPCRATQVTMSLPLSLREEVLYEMHKDLLLKARAP